MLSRDPNYRVRKRQPQQAARARCPRGRGVPGLATAPRGVVISRVVGRHSSRLYCLSAVSVSSLAPGVFISSQVTHLGKLLAGPPAVVETVISRMFMLQSWSRVVSPSSLYFSLSLPFVKYSTTQTFSHKCTYLSLLSILAPRQRNV